MKTATIIISAWSEEELEEDLEAIRNLGIRIEIVSEENKCSL